LTPKRLAPGLSAGNFPSPIITDISGVGLGLAIVKEKVESSRNAFARDRTWQRNHLPDGSAPDAGGGFRGVLVRVQEHFFVGPHRDVERVARVKITEIKTVENRKTICAQTGRRSPWLTRRGAPIAAKGASSDVVRNCAVAVLRAGGRCIAVSIDESPR